MVSRLASGDLTVPRYAATFAAAALFALTGLYGTILGGHLPEVVQTITAHSGFAIDDVRIAGNRETSEIDVLDRLELNGWTSLLGFNADAARARIVGLPWVKSASVRKVYPDVLEVSLVEKKPFAIWQNGSTLTLVEEDGGGIVPFAHERYATLPLVIGSGAAQHAKDFLGRIRRAPELAARVKAYIRIADRRWNLRLENGITIKLPAAAEDAAIADVVAMDREQGLLSRDISAVDLRFDDRLVLQLTPEAAVRRDAALTEAKKKPASREKKI
jgi:cell division protein FtsQ